MSDFIFENVDTDISDDTIEKIFDNYYIKVGKKLPSKYTIWRGISDESGNGMASYGTGLYTTTNKKMASQYGKVIKMDRDALPDFPIRFDTINDFEIWMGKTIDILGYDDKRDFTKDYPDLRHFIQKLGYDGIQIGKGNDIIFVKYPKNKMNEQKIFEAINYEDMFSKVYNAFEKNDLDTNVLKSNIKEVIKDAKTTLKREDRMVWFMRYFKLNYILNSLPKTLYEVKETWAELEKDLKNTAKKANFDLNDPAPLIRPSTLLSRLSHFLSLPIPEIQNFTFTNQTIEDVFDNFESAEDKWKQESEGLISPKEGDKIVVKFDDNTAWWLLARGACEEEAEAMGHCGNVPSVKSGDRILSFRTKKHNNMWQPHLTFILDKNGKIGEAKGRGNEKPAKKYHPYIAKLLMKDDLIKGLKGGGYKPENNFKLSDLNDDLKEQVLKANSEIEAASMSILEKYHRFGLTDEVKYEAEDIVNGSIINTSYIEFSEDGQTVIVDRYNDLERFKNEVDFDLLNIAIAVINTMNDDQDLDDMEERFYPISDDYKDILEWLPEKYLNKIKKSVDYTGNDLGDLADLVDKSKYGHELRKAMLDAIQLKDNSAKDEYMKYVNILLSIYERASENYYVTIDEIQSEDDYIYIRMPVENFMTVVELIQYDNNNDVEEHENASEEEISIYLSIRSQRTFLPVDSWNLRDIVNNSKDYLHDDDYEIFKKYKNYDPSEDEIKGVSQNFDIPIAVKYFTDYIDMNESKDLSRLKMLAGL